MTNRHPYASLVTPWPYVDLLDTLADTPTPEAGTARPHVRNGELWLKLDNGEDIRCGDANRSIFRGQWAAVPAELIYSYDFTPSMLPFTGEGARVAMGGAVGTDKPPYSWVAQSAGAVPSGGGNRRTPTAELDLDTLPQAVGRTLVRLDVWHGRRTTGSVGTAGIRAVTFILETDAGPSYSETIWVSGGTDDHPWMFHSIDDPAGVFTAVMANGSSHSTSLPDGAFAITGLQLFAAPLDWDGYQIGDYVVHDGELWRSIGAENLSTPGDVGAMWAAVALGSGGGGGGAFLDGIHADRPAAADVSGALYACTTHACTYRSDGAAWALYGSPGLLVIPNGGTVPVDTPVGTIIVEEGA